MIGLGPLQVFFLRTFALAVVKNGSVVNFCNWNGGSWHWNVILRGQSFNSETQILEDFNSMLLEVFLDKGCLDETIWIHSPFGKYSCRSFKHELLKQEPIHIWKAI